jgi:hypothetical protein
MRRRSNFKGQFRRNPARERRSAEPTAASAKRRRSGEAVENIPLFIPMFVTHIRPASSLSA